MADGTIRVSTRLDNTQLKKEIKELERELNGIRKEQAKADAAADNVRSKYNAEREFDSQFPEEFSHREEIDQKYAAELEKIVQKQEELNQKERDNLSLQEAKKAKLAEQQAIMDASRQVDAATSGSNAIAKIQTQEQYNSLLEATRAKMAAIEAAAEKVAMQTGVSKDKILAANPAYQKLSDTMGILKAKAGEFGDEAKKAGKKAADGLKKASKEANGFGSAIKAGIKNIGKMALAVFGIRSAYRAVRMAVTEYLSTNEALAGQIDTLKSLLGQVLGPAIEWVVNLLMQAVSAVNTFVYALTGINYVAKANAAALQKQAKATGAAAKAQAQLAGFDEQTKLTDTSSSGSDSNPVTLLDDSIGNISDFMQKLKQQILDGDWYGAGATIGEALMDAIENVDWLSLGEKIGEILGGAFSGVLGFALSLDPVTITLAAVDLVAGLFKGISEELQKVDWVDVGKKLLDLLLLSLLALNPAALITAILFTPEGADLVSAISEFVGTILGALAAMIFGMGKRIWEIASNLWGLFKQYVIDSVDWGGTPGEIVEGLLNGIWEALKGIGQWIIDNIWIPFKEGFCEAFGIASTSKRMYEFGVYIIEGLLNGITGGIQKIVQACKDIWNKIKECFSTVGTWFKEKFSTAATNISDSFTNAITKVKNACSTVWNAIKDCFSSVGTWFKDTFSAAWTKVKDVFSSGGKIFDGIKDGIASTFKTIVNGLISGINKIIATPFNAINGMLNTIRGISVLGIQPFSGLWSYNPLTVPQIPKLALGGIVNRPGRGVPAIIGEAGAEAVLPLENNTEWMDILADKIGGNVTIPIMLDGRKIATYVVDIQKKKAFAMNGA